MIERARAEYARLLRIGFNSHERHYNQAYMAFLRDFIADHEGRSAETVQTEYEQAAMAELYRQQNLMRDMQNRNWQNWTFSKDYITRGPNDRRPRYDPD